MHSTTQYCIHNGWSCSNRNWHLVNNAFYTLDKKTRTIEIVAILQSSIWSISKMDMQVNTQTDRWIQRATDRHIGMHCGYLIHWGRVTHICVGYLTTIGSGNGLAPCRHQAIIWPYTGIWLIGPSGTNFSEILIEIHTFFYLRKYT